MMSGPATAEEAAAYKALSPGDRARVGQLMKSGRDPREALRSIVDQNDAFDREQPSEGERIAAFAAGAGEAVGGVLGAGALAKVSDSFNEKREAMHEGAPGEYGAGEFAGIIGDAALGPAKLVGKGVARLGKAAAGALAPKASKAVDVVKTAAQGFGRTRADGLLGKGTLDKIKDIATSDVPKYTAPTADDVADLVAKLAPKKPTPVAAVEAPTLRRLTPTDQALSSIAERQRQAAASPNSRLKELLPSAEPVPVSVAAPAETVQAKALEKLAREDIPLDVMTGEVKAARAPVKPDAPKTKQAEVAVPESAPFSLSDLPAEVAARRAAMDPEQLAIIDKAQAEKFAAIRKKFASDPTVKADVDAYDIAKSKHTAKTEATKKDAADDLRARMMESLMAPAARATPSATAKTLADDVAKLPSAARVARIHEISKTYGKEFANKVAKAASVSMKLNPL